MYSYRELFLIFSVTTCSGSGSEMDIVVSSVRAYISALNKMLAYKSKPDHKIPENSHVSASDAVPAVSA